MLFDYVYSLKNYNIAFFNALSEPAGEFIIPINEQVIGRKPELFKALHNSGHRFCFSITTELLQYSNKFIKEEIIQNLVRMLFLPNYLRLDGKHIFFIEKEEGEEKKLAAVKNEFYNELKKQGINDPIFELLLTGSPDEDLSNEKCISIALPELNDYLSNGGDAEANFGSFIKKFTFPASFNKKWIIPVISPEDLQNKIRSIERFENWLVATKPFIVKLIEMLALADQDSTSLRSENKVLKFKLENSKYYLQMIRHESQTYVNDVTRLKHEVEGLMRQGKHPAAPAPAFIPVNTDNHAYMMQLQAKLEAAEDHGNIILEWYKKEYEVLPLWYKRFGHIIKVATGKKTFKSLFK